MKPLLPNVAISTQMRSRGKHLSSTTSSVHNNDGVEKPLKYKEDTTKKTNTFYANLKIYSIKFISSISNRRILMHRLICSIPLLIFIFVIRYTLKPTFSSLKEENHRYPRIFLYHFDKAGSVTGFSRLDNLHDDHESKYVFANDVQIHQLRSSRYYQRNYDGPFITEECVQLYDWQLSSFPTCNSLHEVDTLQITSGNVQLIGGGFWRNVWTQNEYDQKDKVVFKTLRFMHEFSHRNFERHRRDAVAMERLTKSPNVLNIFGFCGNSGLFEYGHHGDVESAIWPGDGKESRLSNLDLIRVAIQVCMAILDVHTLEKEPSIAHTDISPAQFIYINGYYKLNDFNRCRFLRRNVTSNGICGFTIPNNPGKLRSPEEYLYEIENEKVDVFSMGHIFYMLLTRKQPFFGIEQEEVYKKVKIGELPELDEDMKKSEDLVHVTLRTAMNMCFTYNQSERPSAKDVFDYLVAQYDIIEQQ